MIRLAVFDLDGTLIDSITDVALCFNAALRACGFPEHPVPRYNRMVGGNLEQVVERTLPQDARTEENITRVKTLYRELYQSSPKANTGLYPGVAELLDALVARGVLLAVNTNKAQALTDGIMAGLFARWPFCAVVGYRDDLPSKPDPAGVYSILTAHGIEPEEAVYIGDGETDIATAHAAGIPMVFVTWGQGEAQPCDERVLFFADNSEQILKFLS
jgi:phosphoglycolate phosphatase